MEQKAKVCLFNPIKCISYPPLNLTFIAAYLRKYGKFEYEIKIVDANFTDNCVSEIVKFNPDITGFTTLSPYMLDVYDFCSQLHRWKPTVPLVCGGVHATINPQEVIEKGFDRAVLGEGERTFTELADKYIENSFKLEDKILNGINGIAYRNKFGLIVTTKDRETISNLDEIPHPARYLLNNEGYHKRYYISRGMNTYGVYTLHGSRGCPYRCIFCCVNFTIKGKVRYHSPEYIADEISELINSYKAKWIFFTDDNFFVNKAYAEKLCRIIIEKGLNRKISWEVQIRSNLIKESDIELLKLMKKAGCRQIDIGFESGNQRMLTFIKGLGITVADHKIAIDSINKSGINVMGTFILGTPSETYEEMMETRQFILDNYKKIHRFQVGCMIPYPGTKIYEITVKKGIIKDNYLELLAQEKAAKSEHGAVVYSDTIPKEDVLKLRMELDNLSLRKISIFEKLNWLVYNILHNPNIAINGCRWMMERSLKYIFQKRRSLISL